MSKPDVLIEYEQMYCAGFGLLFAMGLNALQRRPVMSRAPLLLLSGGAGYGFGTWLADFGRQKVIAREVYLQDYIRSHPEDFPEEVAKKYADVLLPWHPIR